MIDAEEFRKGLRAFSTGVTVITVKADDGVHCMTASSFAAVSVEPQLVLFSIAKTAKAHGLLVGQDRFVVNVLRESQSELAHYFAGRRPGTRVEPQYFWVDGCPILNDTMGYFACRKWAEYPGGDHTIFVGEALKIGRTDHRPLVCSRGIFHGLGNRLDHEPEPAPIADLRVALA